MKSDTVSPMPSHEDQGVIYSEVLTPPIWLLAFVFFLFSSFALSVWAALGDNAGLATIIALFIALIIIRNKVAMKIQIQGSELHIGPAHIDLRYIGEVRALSIDEMRLTRGRNADPAAFLALRFWQPRGVKVEIKDDRDPTPYWLVSSKSSKELARALKK
ncbi:MAG: DUF3093 domain-containing protein [Actinomycetota bacterium]